MNQLHCNCVAVVLQCEKSVFLSFFLNYFFPYFAIVMFFIEVLLV